MSINIEATIRWKGYNPNELNIGSHKRVWVVCEICDRGRWIEMSSIRGDTTHCQGCANKKRLSNPEQLEIMKNGVKKAWKNPELRRDAKNRAISRFKSIDERMKCGCKQSHLGVNHWNWKGGPKESKVRAESKRRNLGCISLNTPLFEGSVGHHITKNYVIYIPEFIHRGKGKYHNIWNGKNMKKINNLAFEYLIGGI